MLDTNKPVGPVSGLAIWRLEVPAHPWGQEVAELVWEGLEWEKDKADQNAWATMSLIMVGHED